MTASASVESILAKCDPREVMRELDRVDFEKDFYLFFEAGWKYIDPSPFVPGLSLEAVADHLMAVARGEINRLIINIPPRMSKSSLTSVSFPAWVWAQRRKTPMSGPGVQFLHASYSQSLSLRDSVKCRRLIESPWYQGLWGDRFSLMGDQNTKTRFDNSATGSRLCTSVGSTLTGEGGNVIIIDDPNAAQEAFSDATIETTINWWDSALSTRLNDPKTGAFIVIQQRLAENDLTGHILSKDVGEWVHLCLPMKYEPERSFSTLIGWQDWRTEPGELLWPDRFGEAEVDSLERTLGPFAAAGQLQQRPEVKGGGVVKRDWWRLWDHDRYPQFDFIIASLDTAYTIKQENDYSALTIWGVFSGDSDTHGIANVVNQIRPDENWHAADRSYIQGAPRVLLMHAWQEKLELHELVAKVADSARKMKIDLLLIENKAAGISVAQEIRRLYGSEDFGVQLVDPRAQDKVSRLYAVQHLFAEGLVYAPDRAWADMVITQTSVFPKGKNDDLVDTVSQAMRHLRECGMLQRAQERLADLDAASKFSGRSPSPLYPG